MKKEHWILEFYELLLLLSLEKVHITFKLHLIYHLVSAILITPRKQRCILRIRQYLQWLVGNELKLSLDCEFFLWQTGLIKLCLDFEKI